MEISKEEILHIANLADLNIAEEESKYGFKVSVLGVKSTCLCHF